MHSGQLMYRRFRSSDRPETADVSLVVRVMYLEWGHTCQSFEPTTLAHEPALLNPSPTNGAFSRRRSMSDQVTNKSAVPGESKMHVLEMAPPSSTPPSDKLLSRIAILLFILVAGSLTVFGFYASSICITVILAGFLAILVDPVVVILEKLHLPRSVAAAGVVLAGMSLVGLLGYVLYGKAVTFAEELPVYASKGLQGARVVLLVNAVLARCARRDCGGNTPISIRRPLLVRVGPGGCRRQPQLV
jgi:hypothetical protein